MSRFEDLKIQHSIFHVQHSLFKDKKVISQCVNLINPQPLLVKRYSKGTENRNS
jgi:hypothetical protein